MALRAGWEGWLQRLASRLAGLGAGIVLSSPAPRCAVPAAGLARRLGTKLEEDPRLLELDFGEWEGMAWDSIPRAALDRWAADPRGFAPPGGESGDAFCARLQDFARGLRRHRRAALVLTHGGPLRLLPALLTGRAPDLVAPAPAQGNLRIIRVKDGRG